MRDRHRASVQQQCVDSVTDACTQGLLVQVSPQARGAQSWKQRDDDDDGDDWSLEDLRLYRGVKRECGSFSVVDTEEKRKAAVDWGMMTRRRSINLGGGGVYGEGGGMLRVCRTSVSFGRDKERRKKLGRREDRRVEVDGDRNDVVCRGKKWRSRACGRNDEMVRECRANTIGGDGCEVHARCNSDPVMFRCGRSFQSSNSSAALSVSTVTQASHMSS